MKKNGEGGHGDIEITKLEGREAAKCDVSHIEAKRINSIAINSLGFEKLNNNPILSC